MLMNIHVIEELDLCVGEHLTAPAAGSTTSTHPSPADISCRGRSSNIPPISAHSRVVRRTPSPWTRRRGSLTVITAAGVIWASRPVSL